MAEFNPYDPGTDRGESARFVPESGRQFSPGWLLAGLGLFAGLLSLAAFVFLMQMYLALHDFGYQPQITDSSFSAVWNHRDFLMLLKISMLTTAFILWYGRYRQQPAWLTWLLAVLAASPFWQLALVVFLLWG